MAFIGAFLIGVWFLIHDDPELIKKSSEGLNVMLILGGACILLSLLKSKSEKFSAMGWGLQILVAVVLSVLAADFVKDEIF